MYISYIFLYFIVLEYQYNLNILFNTLSKFDSKLYNEIDLSFVDIFFVISKK